MEIIENVKFKRIHPKKFALWMAMVSMIMFFSAFTSAYIVRKSAGNWLSFPLPNEFFISTFFIILSSIFLYLSHKAFTDSKIKLFKIYFFSGILAGMFFILFQYLGWNSLNALEITIKTNQSSSFFYLITYAHLLHVLGGIAALSTTTVGIFRNRFDFITDKRLLKLDLVFTYWHFVDLLWIYLFVFLLLQQ